MRPPLLTLIFGGSESPSQPIRTFLRAMRVLPFEQALYGPRRARPGPGPHIESLQGLLKFKDTHRPQEGPMLLDLP